MSVRVGQSWQTSLADLSLILFMATAAAVSQQPDAPPGENASVAPSARTEPLSVYVAAPDAPPLSLWLHQQAEDPRQQLTITARYGRNADARAQAKALSEATRLLEQAGSEGREARIVVEPGDGPARAVLAYDSPTGEDAAANGTTR
ncbi:hypothetical protein [Novosphingobium malaysiense]|uniref:Uncharacterized protein n=1 Tax=Novosphingobium malaysiense TaxID=1348853 RepID=A0A0B1ZQP9_9SPHN|nr:hypothetical protein [Novosphingobium malaysiense]KHK93475.1 hypothetical protein LK12_04215 [Novosphingobium malaysiense]